MLETTDLREKSVKELQELEIKARKEVLDINLQLAAGGQKDLSLVGKKKKEIARILTILNEKKRGEKANA
ncbi:MAG: 50S ribosomal protein L29 [Candidatus Saganbacteria bacterium]|nr:50S ribosomal protein L29 [Candidatus Saganbacteria bacterium]